MIRTSYGKMLGAAGVAAALALAACGPGPRGVWDKDGLTQDELKRDQKACVAEAGSYGFLSGSSSPTGGPTAATRQQGDIYRACMESKGYSELPPGSLPKPKSPLPQSQ